jgi:uncharacterized protein YmfQ (DUF2313 family)
MIAADYTDLLYALLPRGEIWPKEPNDAPAWHALLEALAQEPARVDAAAFAIADAWIEFPTELLVDFERILSLTAGASSIATRRAAIIAKLASNGGPSLPDMQSIADAFGATVTQHVYSLFTMGIAAMGAALRSDQWAATWTVTYTGPASSTLESAMLAAAPLNTTLLFVVI